MNKQKIVLVGLTASEDFPVTKKYAEKGSKNMTVLLKIDLKNN